MNKSVSLFTTTFCTRCPALKKRLEDAGIKFEVVDAIKNPILVKEFGVKMVPSVVFLENETFINLGGTPDIEKLKGWVNEN